MIVVMVPVGIVALVLGEGASRAFTIIGGSTGGAIIARAMGALLAAGGLVALGGVAARHAFVELVGLSLVSAGAFIYSAGVVLGLGWNGAIASGLALGYAVGAAGRVILLSGAAHSAYREG